ncbi:hypothetical protein C0V80_09410, partial [Leuconostoc pseudomesenteroides]|nr:hypothetical protein [Leuconostoc pseudomesenteroides]
VLSISMNNLVLMIVFSFVENAYIFGIDKIIQRRNKKIKCIPITILFIILLFLKFINKKIKC